MAERNEVGCLLRRHDPSNPRRADHVPFLRVARLDGFQRARDIRTRPSATAMRRVASLLRNVDHARFAVCADMRKSGRAAATIVIRRCSHWRVSVPWAADCRPSSKNHRPPQLRPLRLSLRGAAVVRTRCAAACPSRNCRDPRKRVRTLAREPTIAYVLLRNAHFGPRLASSVELCVRDLIRHSRYAISTLVICPKVDDPFEGIRTEPIPDVSIGGNLGKAWAIGRLMRSRNVAVALVENHLPAAAFIAKASGLPVILHSHAYENAPSGSAQAKNPKRRTARSSLALLSSARTAPTDSARTFPRRKRPCGPCRTGSTWPIGPTRAPKEKTILCVGRALDDKGHLEAMAAIARALESRPDWSARMILSATDREPETSGAARSRRAVRRPGSHRSQSPYAQVKMAWERAAVGMVLTKTPEPFGRTALEALASGTALITSGLGGLAEVCGPDALTVDPRNARRGRGGPRFLAGFARASCGACARRARARRGPLRHSHRRNRMDNFIDEVIAQKVDDAAQSIAS